MAKEKTFFYKTKPIFLDFEPKKKISRKNKPNLKPIYWLKLAFISEYPKQKFTLRSLGEEGR
ncbi:MAG: hypothetical protein JW804_03820, partial [Sedimentisphaerales bacterium]|nr:hypothetical protein [Sedimentisphaerales bacterium]